MEHQSTGFGEKISCIRKAENLSQSQLAEITGISINTIKNFESRGKEITALNLQKITNHPQFQKYTLWLMTDQAAPEIGQISPVIEQEQGRATG